MRGGLCRSQQLFAVNACTCLTADLTIWVTVLSFFASGDPVDCRSWYVHQNRIVALMKTVDTYASHVEDVGTLWKCASLLGGDTRLNVDHIFGPIYRGGGAVVAGYVDKEVVGVIWGMRCQDQATMYIPYIYISPAGRGLGLYQNLTYKIFDVARNQGYKFAFGLADPDNVPSIKGMVRCGFHLIAKRRKFYYPDAQGFFYFRDLTDPNNPSPPADSPFWKTIDELEPL